MIDTPISQNVTTTETAMCCSLPLRELPYFGFHCSALNTDLSKEGDSLFQMKHCQFWLLHHVEKVSQIVVECSLMVAVSLPVGAT
jgi:hypothetical protein